MFGITDQGHGTQEILECGRRPRRKAPGLFHGPVRRDQRHISKLAGDRECRVRRQSLEFFTGRSEFGKGAGGENPNKVEQDAFLLCPFVPVHRADRIDQDLEFALLFEAGQIRQGCDTILVPDPFSGQQFKVHRTATPHLEQVVGGHAPEEKTSPRLTRELDRTALGRRLLPVGLKSLEGLNSNEIEVFIRGLVGRYQGDLKGLGLGEEAGGPDGFEADSWVRIAGQGLQHFDCAGNSIPPVAQDARCRGSRPEIGRFQDLLEQVNIHHVVRLM